jgi:Icc-related predicted phosphoesterase
MSSDLRILFATDLHGSETTFRKFVNASKQLNADVLLLGGDLAGKAVVPITKSNGRYTARVFGKEHIVEEGDGLDELKRSIRATGQYVYVCDVERFEALKGDPEQVKAVFMEAMCTILRDWFDLAAERLALTGTRLVAIAGNDDPFEMDAVIAEHPFAELCDERVVSIDDRLTVVGFSGSNHTPWDSPREYDEAEILARLTRVMSEVPDPASTILNVHPPPADSGLDTAPKVDSELNIVFESGAVKMIPVGSTAVRSIIEEFQPLLGAHGHVHESRAVTKLGRTVIVNPGSEYSEGMLAAAFIRVTKKGVRTQFLSG